MWIRLTVRINHTITVEVVIAGRIASIVTSVSPYLLTCNLALAAQSLIDEVPDISTLIGRILTHKVPILLKSTNRVTHCVRILTLNQWTWIITLRITLTTVIVVVHWAVDIRLAILSCLLILARTRWVVCLHPIIAVLEVLTITSFVTQRPHDNGRVVLVGHQVMLLTLHMGIVIVLTASQRTFTITHSVTLDIRF